jgi:hypothetical protein
MSNTFTTVIPQLLAQGLLALREMAIMPRICNRNYDMLAAQQGSAITIPAASAVVAKAVTPSTTIASTGDDTTTSVTLTLDQWYEAPFTMDDKDMKEVMNGYLPMRASEAIKALANNVDSAIFGNYTGIYGFAGTAGTDPFASSTAEATEARKVLTNQLAPLQDRRFVMNADAEANALGLRAFQDTNFANTIADIEAGNLHEKLGFSWWIDQNVPDHTCGARNTASVTAATQTVGTSTILTATGSGDTAIGDQFTVAGDTQVYVCSNVTDVGGGTISFTPAAKVAWVSGAAITFKGTASTAYSQNIAMHRDCIAFASRPLQDIETPGSIIQTMADPISGIVLRLEVNRQYKQTRFSYDILYGTALVRAQYGCRVYGA